MRRVPCARSVTRPASFSTLRCCDTAGRDTGKSRARSPTADGASARRSKMARRVGSLRALKALETWLALTNGKRILTNSALSSRQRRRRARDNRERRSRPDDRRLSYPDDGAVARKGAPCRSPKGEGGRKVRTPEGSAPGNARAEQ